MAKAQETKVSVKDLNLAIKALETLQEGKEKGKLDFAVSVYNEFDRAISNFKCAIARVRGKKRDSIKMEITKSEEEAKYRAEQFKAPWSR
mgnify:CR=1 FL=1